MYGTLRTVFKAEALVLGTALLVIPWTASFKKKGEKLINLLDEENKDPQVATRIVNLLFGIASLPFCMTAENAVMFASLDIPWNTLLKEKRINELLFAKQFWTTKAVIWTFIIVVSCVMKTVVDYTCSWATSIMEISLAMLAPPC